MFELLLPTDLYLDYENLTDCPDSIGLAPYADMPTLSEEESKSYISRLFNIDPNELDFYIDGLAAVDAGLVFDSEPCSTCMQSGIIGFNVCASCLGKGVTFIPRK